VHLKTKHPGLDEGLLFSCPYCSFKTIKRENYATHVVAHEQAKDGVPEAVEPEAPANKKRKTAPVLAQQATATASDVAAKATPLASTETKAGTKKTDKTKNGIKVI
jgi:hypothetical protein